MANPEHVDMLSRGVDEWHKWRRKLVDEAETEPLKLDLSGVDLPGVDLENSNLI